LFLNPFLFPARYGGIFERGSREYTLDDFYSIQLDKLERYTCLKHSGIVIAAEGDESSSDESDEDAESDKDDIDDGDSDGATRIGEDDAGLKLKSLDEGNEDEVVDQVIEDVQVSVCIILYRCGKNRRGIKHDEMLAQATAFMGVSKDTTRSAEDIISTPEPGESLAIFYARSRKFHSNPSLPFGVNYLGGEYWTQKAHAVSDNRGKQLRRDGFSFAEERYGASNWSVLACELQFIHFVPCQRGTSLSLKQWRRSWPRPVLMKMR